MANLFKFAENILNNLDQSTQSSIQSALNNKSSNGLSSNTNDNNGGSRHHQQFKSKSNRMSSKSGGIDENNETQLMSSHSSASLKFSNNQHSMASNQSVGGASAAFKSFSSHNSSTSLSGSSWHPRPPSSSVTVTNKDDELLDFLNSSDFSQLSSEPALNLNSKASLEINTSNLDTSPSPATFGSDVSPGSAAIAAASTVLDASGVSGGGLVQFSIGSGGSDTKSKHSETEEDETASVSGDVTDAVNERKEKALLKTEIKSLTQEIQSLMKRIKNIEDGKWIWFQIFRWLNIC